MGEPTIRASDADRDRVAAEIREHYAQGRLDGEELGQRLDRVYAARTLDELETLRSDLPELAPGSPARSEHAAQRAQLTRALVQRTGTALVPFLVCTVVWLLSGASGSFWPAWALLIAAIPLVRNGWRLYGPAPDLEAVHRELGRDATDDQSSRNASSSS